MVYREVERRLKQHDSRFQIFVTRGRGSHRMVFHPDINGKRRSYPLPFHGNKTHIPRA